MLVSLEIGNQKLSTENHTVNTGLAEEEEARSKEKDISKGKAKEEKGFSNRIAETGAMAENREVAPEQEVCSLSRFVSW